MIFFILRTHFEKCHIECSDDENFVTLIKMNRAKNKKKIFHNIQKRRYMRFLSNSEEGNDRRQDAQIAVSPNGAIWRTLKEGGAVVQRFS